MTSQFPFNKDNISTNKTNSTKSKTIHPLLHNLVASAINAIQNVLLGFLRHNILDYGADPNGVADSTTAIANAIAAANSSVVRRRVYVPAGTYISGPQDLNVDAITIEGEGKFVSVIKFKAGSSGHFFNLNDSWRLTFDSVDLDGNMANCPNVEAVVYGDGSGNPVFKYCNIHDAKYGIKIENVGGAIYEHTDVYLCSSQGMWVNTDSEVTGCFVGRNGWLDAWDSCNMFVVGWDARILNCHLWGTPEPEGPYGNMQHRRGIIGQWANDVSVIGTIIEEHGREGILLYGRANGWKIVGNYIEDNGLEQSNTYSGIRFEINSQETAHRNVITSNRFGKQGGVGDFQGQLKYCIEEDQYCNYNVIEANQYAGAYLTGPFKLFGSNNKVEPGEVLVRHESDYNLVNNGMETTIFSKVIPGGSLAVNRRLRVVIWGEYLNNSGSSRTLSVAVRFGGTTMIYATTPSIPASAEKRTIFLELELHNKEASDAQIAVLRGVIGSTTPAFTTGIGAWSDGATAERYPVEIHGTAEEDSYVDQLLDITFQNSVQDANVGPVVKSRLMEFTG